MFIRLVCQLKQDSIGRFGCSLSTWLLNRLCCQNAVLVVKHTKMCRFKTFFHSGTKIIYLDLTVHRAGEQKMTRAGE